MMKDAPYKHKLSFLLPRGFCERFMEKGGTDPTDKEKIDKKVS
jgi:hypothetical protein